MEEFVHILETTKSADLNWYVYLTVYAISLIISSVILFTFDWKQILVPKFRTNNWPMVVYIFMTILAAFILGSFLITIFKIGTGGAW